MGGNSLAHGGQHKSGQTRAFGRSAQSYSMVHPTESLLNLESEVENTNGMILQIPPDRGESENLVGGRGVEPHIQGWFLSTLTFQLRSRCHVYVPDYQADCRIPPPI